MNNKHRLILSKLIAITLLVANLTVSAKTPTIPDKYSHLFQPSTTTAEIKKIHIDEAKYLFDNYDDVLFIDARSPAEYNREHIKEAISIPVNQAPTIIPKLHRTLKNKLLVTYCHGVSCHLSDKTAMKLFEAGYRNILIFFGGWNEWRSANYPIKDNYTPQKNDLLLSEATSIKKIDKINAEEAKFLFFSGRAIFFDVDNNEEYKQKRINRSISFTREEFDKRVTAYDKIMKKKVIVITGRGLFNPRIKKIATMLYTKGYKKIVILKNGIVKCEKAGIPITNNHP